MKLHIGDLVSLHVNDKAYTLQAKVEDASKGDVIQAKVESIEDARKNAQAVFSYEIGQVYEFPRKDIRT